MEIAVYLLYMYTWFTLALLLMIRLFKWDTKIKQVIILLVLIIFPVTILAYLEDNIKNMISEEMKMKQAQVYKLQKGIETLVDKAAIRALNTLDYLRGDYEPLTKSAVVVHKTTSRAQFHRGK